MFDSSLETVPAARIILGAVITSAAHIQFERLIGRNVIESVVSSAHQSRDRCLSYDQVGKRNFPFQRAGMFIVNGEALLEQSDFSVFITPHFDNRKTGLLGP